MKMLPANQIANFEHHFEHQINEIIKKHIQRHRFFSWRWLYFSFVALRCFCSSKLVCPCLGESYWSQIGTGEFIALDYAIDWPIVPLTRSFLCKLKTLFQFCSSLAYLLYVVMFQQPSPVKDFNHLRDQRILVVRGLNSASILDWSIHFHILASRFGVQSLEFFESFHVHCLNFTWNRSSCNLGCSRRVFASPIAKWSNNDAKYRNILVHFSIEESFH